MKGRIESTPVTSTLVALGANLPGPVGPPLQTLTAALEAMPAQGITVTSQSAWFSTPAYPAAAGPDFVNAVVKCETVLDPEATLAALHRVEREMGRVRANRWEARVCDLDLLAWGDAIWPDKAAVAERMAGDHATLPDGLILPHPALQTRGFVLVPLVDVAPEWRHPLSGMSGADMLAALPRAERASIQMIE